jgi:cytidylate kinase
MSILLRRQNGSFHALLLKKDFQKDTMRLLYWNMRKFVVIAIDGTAAAGKTSTSLRIADRYNLLMVSTGMHYRAISLKMMETAVASDDIDAVDNFLQKISLETHILNNIANISIGGELFDEKDLRSGRVNEVVGQYSAVTNIRKFLLSYQRAQVKIAKDGGFSGVIMEGRDIASVVLPHADLKFFLEATARERSLRRRHDREDDCIGKRDKIDDERTICGEGVHRIDTGKNDLDAVVAIISIEIDKILGR